MKKNKITIIIASVLILLSLFIVLYKNEIIFSNRDKLPSSDAFAIQDSSKVTKIFIADMHGNNVLLTKKGGLWMLQDTIPALQYNVKSVLGTLLNLTIRQSVPENALGNVNKALAVGATKVEIYEIAPKFSIFGIDFFKKEKKTKTYYFGSATQDNLASYAYLEGMKEPYIIYRPGFRGFITPQFSQFEADWRSHVLFNTKFTRIESVEFIDYINPEESFTVVKNGPRSFDMYNWQQEKVNAYDTTKLFDMLTEFREKNYQSLIQNMSDAEKDSIIKQNLFKTIKLKNTDGRTTTLNLYKMVDEVQIIDEDSDLVDQIQEEINRDKCYGMLTDKPNEFYIIQYFHFDRQLQPFSYFLKKRIN